MTAAADDRAAAVLVSAVLFEDARIVPGLDALAAACAERGVELLVDAYHALGALPFTAPAACRTPSSTRRSTPSGAYL